MQLKAGHLAFKVTLIYVIVAGCWVAFSDELVAVFINNPEQRIYLSIIKGLSFVVVTGGLLYQVLRRVLGKWEQEVEQRRQAEVARQMAGERLRQNEEQLRLVLEAVADGVWDWNLKSGAAYLSPRYCEITGCPAGEVAAAREFFDRLVHPEDLPAVQKTVNEHLAGKSAQSVNEFRMVAKDGTVKWIWGRGKVVERAPDGTPLRMVGTISDITLRKQVEASLIKSKQRYQDLFEHMNEGFAYCQIICENGRAQDFIYLAVNPMFTTLTGLTEVTGKRVTEVIPGIRESDPELFDIYGRVAATGKPEKTERFVEGLKMWFALSVYGTQPGYFVVVFDVITERKLAEQKLRESEERYRQLFEVESDAIFLVDLETGRFADANPAAVRMYGYRREEFLQMRPEDVSDEPADTRAYFASGSSQVAFRRHRKKNGTLFPVEITGGQVEYWGRHFHLGAIRDITVRKQAEEQMHLQISALAAAANAIVITDRAGKIEWVNPAFTRLTGYTANEAIGNNPRILKSGQHSPDFYAGMWQAILAGNVWHGELVNKRKDGSFYTEETTVTPVRVADGQITHFVAIKQDVTERRQLENRLRQRQKMEAIGQLAGGVAHDFNNILAVIQLQAGLLKSEQNISRQQLDFATEIEKASERAANLTRQLLLFSRQQTLQLRDLYLNDVVANITKMLQRVLGEEIQMQFKFASQPLLIHADAGMLDQVLMNLTVNARDAMPKGGRLIIETAAVEFDEVTAARCSQARPGAFACLGVTDTGSGIPPEILTRIFEPFFTTKDVGKGTGLGLATVFGIVQQHQGWINVYSEAGQGTTFRVYLPRLARPSAPQVIASPAAAVRGGNETILLAEDDFSLRLSVRVALSRLGYQVLEAATGAEALEVWKQHRGEIRLLLTDLVMPGGLTGKNLAGQLLEQEPKLKVIYASGYSAEIAGKDFPLEEGVNFLTKPFEARRLAQAVRNSLDQI